MTLFKTEIQVCGRQIWIECDNEFDAKNAEAVISDLIEDKHVMRPISETKPNNDVYSHVCLNKNLTALKAFNKHMRDEMRLQLSSCCAVPIPNFNECDLCPSCGEHCGVLDD